jgi:hypothetical protein
MKALLVVMQAPLAAAVPEGDTEQEGAAAGCGMFHLSGLDVQQPGLQTDQDFPVLACKCTL